MISFSFILNFSLSYLLRSNLISDSLKAPSDLHNISLNSPSVQTIWIPHVEKTFICETDLPLTKPRAQATSSGAEIRAGPRTWRWGSRMLFPLLLPVDSRMYRCTSLLTIILGQCIQHKSVHMAWTGETGHPKDYPQLRALLTLRGEEMLPSKVRPLSRPGGSAYGVRHLLRTNLSSSICDVGQII